MTLKGILSGTASWLRAHKYEESGQCEQTLDEDGLLATDFEPDEDSPDAQSAEAVGEPVMVSTIASMERRESVERLQDGLGQLVDQLQRIDEHLSQQVAQHEELLGRVGQLPELLESLPSAVEDQRRLTAQLLEQSRRAAAKDQQFSEMVAQIPAASARQTDALIDINHHLAAAADIDVQMADGFIKFRATLDRLSQNTVDNTDGIRQMSRTFAASDRYLKYVIAKLNKRYAWTLAVALSVCTAVVASLVGVILYLAL